jgi:hypothetical protein
MTISTIVAMIVSLGIPLLVAVIAKEALGPPWKALITLFLTTAAGVIASQIGAASPSLAGWGHVGLDVLMSYLTAAVAYLATWKPAGVTAAIHRATDPFGIGPKQPSHIPEHAAPPAV